jgi:hypothetical protein
MTSLFQNHNIMYDISILNWGCPADLITNQTFLNLKVHGHTSRAPQVGIEPTSLPTQAVALPTKPQIPVYDIIEKIIANIIYDIIVSNL